MKLSKQGIEQTIIEYREAIGQTKHRQAEIEVFLASVSKTLMDYCAQFPEDTEFQYSIKKRFGRMQLRVQIPGEKKSIYEYGENSKERELLRRIQSMKLAISQNTQYVYFRGANQLIFLTPPAESRGGLRNPIILALVIGLLAGLLVSTFPENISGFLVNDLAAPVLSTAIAVITGVMGPVIFLSLITSVSTADSIGEVNRLGKKLLKRFLVIAVFITLLIVVIGLLVFSLQRGQADVSFSPEIVVGMLLSVIPTNLFTPFTENNFPQLLVLGLVTGVALLLLNRKESSLGNLLMDLRDWSNELLRLVLKVTPLIPGLTLFKIFAEKDFSGFLKGWKFIAAAYVCMAILLLLKMIKVKIRCRNLNFSRLMRSMRPAANTAFVSGVEIVAMKKCMEAIDGPLAISTGFSSIWIPLNQSMLSPIGPIYYVLAPLFIAELTGTPVSAQYLFVLVILCVQLSLANPGITAGNTIIFNSLGISTDYVGLFSAYSVFLRNASAAYGVVYRLLEITETAYRTGNIDLDRFNKGTDTEAKKERQATL